MKIHGVDGMSPEHIRDEINRGGRMVIYTYCVSVVLMTFKRPAGIRLIKPGQSAAAAGWPYVLVSFLFGWWGFPWGPVYTIQSIYHNLCGGIDVTGDVMRSLVPAGTAPQPALQQAAPGATPARGFDFRVAVIMLAAILLAALIGICGYSYYRQQHLTVVLVSGLDTPYSVVLNGEPRTLAPYAAEVLTMPEGVFTLEDAPGSSVVGGPQTFEFSLPLLDHLSKANVAVINPDRVAVLFNTEVPYYKDGEPIPENDAPGFTVLANRSSYFFPRPDYVIEDARQRIDMPSGVSRVVKHRLESIPKPDVRWMLNTVNEKSGYPAARELAMRLAIHRTDEEFLGAVLPILQPDDVAAFFQLHLADRPVLVEWHRYYQQRISTLFPGRDISAEYRALLAAEPDNGALCYLLARLLADHAEQTGLWKRALSAKPPCYHAYNALGFDAMSVCNFEEAIAYYDESMKSGLSNKGLTHYRRQALIAVGRVPEVLAEIAAERKAKPLDMTLAEDEINTAFAASHDLDAANKMKDAYLTVYKGVHPPADYVKDAEAILGAAVANLAGDPGAYGRLLARFEFPFYQFRAAIATGDTSAARKILEDNFAGDADARLLLFLLAERSSGAQAADTEFAAAQEAMQHGTPDQRNVASELAKERPDARVICDAHLDVDSKRILLTALGARYPGDRQAYFAMARKLNFSPEFPHQFLLASLKE